MTRTPCFLAAEGRLASKNVSKGTHDSGYLEECRFTWTSPHRFLQLSIFSKSSKCRPPSRQRTTTAELFASDPGLLFTARNSSASSCDASLRTFPVSLWLLPVVTYITLPPQLTGLHNVSFYRVLILYSSVYTNIDKAIFNYLHFNWPNYNIVFFRSSHCFWIGHFH